MPLPEQPLLSSCACNIGVDSIGGAPKGPVRTGCAGKKALIGGPYKSERCIADGLPLAIRKVFTLRKRGLWPLTGAYMRWCQPQTIQTQVKHRHNENFTQLHTPNAETLHLDTSS